MAVDLLGQQVLQLLQLIHVNILLKYNGLKFHLVNVFPLQLILLRCPLDRDSLRLLGYYLVLFFLKFKLFKV